MTTHTLTPKQSLEEGGFIFVSELILVRIPVAEGDQLLQASTTVPLTGIPQPSQPQPSQPQPSQPQRRRPPQHHGFVRVATPHPRGFYLEVYPIISFSHQGGAVNGYNAAPETVKRGLIPLPPLSSTFPTPPLFGPQLFIGGWVNSKDAFLSVYPVEFELHRSEKFKKSTPQILLSHDELIRMDTFRNRLSTDTPLDQGGPSGNNGGEQNRTANEAQDGNATDFLPEYESTDEDEGRSPTMTDDLRLLAHSHPLWIPELEKYLEAKIAEMRAESCLKVESWLQSQ